MNTNCLPKDLRHITTFLLEDPLCQRQIFFMQLVSYPQAYLLKLGVFEDCLLH